MATMDDVAKGAGVSIMTVSRVMNGSQLVSDKTTERIKKVAQEMGYQPNLLARSLVTNRTNTIGVLVTQVENPIYNIFSSTIINEAEEFGYDVMLSNANDMEGALRAVKNLLGKCIDGLIVFPIEFSLPTATLQDMMIAFQQIQEYYRMLEGFISEFGQREFPLVVLGNTDTLKNKSHVDIDYHLSGKLAVDYLVENGHRNIGYIRHSVGNISLWGKRLQGFLDGMMAHGLEVNNNWVVDSLDTAESGYAAMSKLIEQNDQLPTAVSCANDFIAAGAIYAATAKGLRVPEDISVIGNDGSYVCDIVVPHLTSVSINPCQAGKLCVQLLIESIENEGSYQDIVVTPSIKAGKSVSAI